MVSVAAQEPVPRITVMTFRSSEPELGAKVADELRNRISDEFSSRKLFVVPTKDIVTILEQSGFSVQDSLPPYEEKALANLVRADEYVTGWVRHGADGVYSVDADLVLTHDNTWVQPLPTSQNKDLGDALDRVRDNLKEALKQIPAERACLGKAHGGDLAGAIAAGQAGVMAYPQATLARICMVTAQYAQYSQAKTAADSLSLADSALTTALAILRIDSLSVPTLRLATELYKVRGDSARSRQALLTLVRADPTDTKLREQVINELAAGGHAADAVPLVKDLLDRNPGDPETLRTAFLVFINANDYTDAVEVGPQLIRADTTAADSLYYIRMANAYQQLQQPQRAAEVMAEATAHLPNSPQMWILYSYTLRQAGQTQQATDALKRASTLNPGSAQSQLMLANQYEQQSMPDSVYAVLQQAATTVTDSSGKLRLAQFSLARTSDAFKKANASKDSSDLHRAISFANMSNRFDPSADAKYIAGFSSLLMAQNGALGAEKTKSCSDAQMAQASLKTAQTNLTAIEEDAKYGAAVKGNAANITQLGKAIDSQLKRFCK
jgi:tetratricopeptide (TPR) repeat protein